MKLSTLCHRLDQKRRILLLIAALVAILALIFLLPGMLAAALAAPVLACGAAYVLWRFCGLGQFGPAYQRTPRPQDAQAQTVLIDADLLDEGLAVQAVAQPIVPATALSLRMGSGALLLGTAMTLLSDETTPAQRIAIHRAVTRLNIHPDRMKAHSPILHRDQTDDYTAVTVQDGPHERTYYLAEAAVLARLCSTIWEDEDTSKGVRPITSADRGRIQDAAAYMAQSNGRVLAYATALGDERPTFLGLCTLGQRIRMDAVQELSRLKAMGLAVMLREVDDPTIDTTTLRTALDIPDVHGHADLYLSTNRDAPFPDTLTIRPVQDQPISEPILHLRERFAQAERLLTGFTAMLSVLLVCCFLAGNAFASLAVTAVLLCGVWCLGLPEDMKVPGWPIYAAAMVGSVLLRLFLSAAIPSAACGACGLYCVLLAGAAVLYHEQALPPLERLLPVLGVTVVLAAVLAALTGATWLSALLAVLFAAIVALTGWLLRGHAKKN